MAGWKLEVVVPTAAAEAFAEAVGSLCAAVASFEIPDSGLWRVEGYTSAMPPHADAAAAMAIAAARAGIAEPEFTCVPLPDIDWVAENQESFQPIAAGRYFVRPSHHDGPVPYGATVLTLDAGAAFGTGEHATTKGCLLALDGLARCRRFRHPLDVGCGSGILSLAMAATWKKPVLAVDIDPTSVQIARENAVSNGLARLVRARRSDGLSDGVVCYTAPYDLITANILAGPLVLMAVPLCRHLAPGGVAILSGLLAAQENAVRNAYRAQGLALLHRIVLDGWHTLVLVRRRRGRPSE